ncbi:hypothetical protein Mro03_01310 [Microbispora rosea subsp. rosea]|nr:hypothetical protein Mro03_01310 [Microbispora rosea subsp. rosea]
MGAELDRMHATNYLGVIAVIRAASRVLRADGRIITVSSGLGSRVGVPGLADYSATKSGIERYTMGVARDLGPRGITANVVVAGLMESGMEPPDPARPWSARCPCSAWVTPTKSPWRSPSWRAPPRRTSPARCWTPTAATTPEAEARRSA